MSNEQNSEVDHRGSCRYSQGTALSGLPQGSCGDLDFSFSSFEVLTAFRAYFILNRLAPAADGAVFQPDPDAVLCITTAEVGEKLSGMRYTVI